MPLICVSLMISDCSLPGSSVHGICQARILEWVTISFSNAWKWKVKVKSLSHVQLLATPWAAAHQAPPSMGFSRQEYWSGVPLPSPGIWMYHNWCTYSSVGGYLGVTNKLIWTVLCMSLGRLCSFLWFIAKSEITESLGRHMFSFTMHCQMAY